MRFITTILTLLLALPLSAQDIQEVRQFNLGELLPTDSVSFVIEFPEFKELTKAEVRQLQEQGFTAKENVEFSVTRSMSRGKTYAQVSYVPVVLKGKRWMRMTNYDLKPVISGPKLSAAAKLSVMATTLATNSSRYAAHSVLASGKWVKIRVPNEGIYQLTTAQLQSAGFSDPSKVKLYGYGGRLLPDRFTFTGSDALIDDLNEVPLYRRDGSVLFFAEGLTRWTSTTTFQTNTFSQYSYYFLTESTDSDDTPASFETLDAPTGTTTEVTEVPAHALFDNDAFVWYGGGRDFYDSNDLADGHTFTLSLPGHTGGECQVAYDVSAQSSTTSTTATITQVSTSETVVERSISAIGEGETARGYRGTFTATLGTSERFTVNTTNTGHLNYLYTTYPQQLSTAYTTEAFSTDESGAVTLSVANATAYTRVWQIGDSQTSIAELPGTLDGTTYNAQATDGSQRFVLVDLSKTYDAPTIVGTIDNQDLHADSCYDFVIIVPASGKLTTQAERLAQAHRDYNGLRVKVVRADQLFNEFSSGTPDAAAYRRYMKMLYDKAPSDDDRPRYLLLFGDCAYDNRMITSDWRSGDPDDFLLAYERNDQETYYSTSYSIGTLHSYVTDDYYGLLDDSEGSRLTTDYIDLGIGRFLCHDADDAEWLVDQSISYLNNEKTGVWKNRLWAMADSGDENLHMRDAQYVCQQIAASAPESFMVRRLYLDAYDVTSEARGVTYPEATKKLKTLMQQGSLIFNYNGHGSPDRLSHKFLLTKEEMAENVSSTLPIWVFASCEITPYDQIIADLGRNALFNTQGPAVAVLCASRSVYANYNRSLNMGFMEFVFGHDDDGNRYTLGDALRLTKCELIRNTAATIGTDQTINKLKYALLGDPALELRYPDPGIVVDSINGTAVTSETFNQLAVGGTVKFSGYVNGDTTANTADESFNGTLTGTVYMPQQSITCKGYGNTSADPLVYTDYTQTIFEGAVEVKNGRFTLELMIPRGVTFSTDQALLSLYAVSSDNQKEFNGSYDQFCINGTAPVETPDTIGPDVYLYIDSPDFPDGGTVGTSGTLYAAISDTTAISMMSGNLGHDMELWFDGDNSSAETVNDYFSFDYGSYNSGLIEYPLSSLTTGKHTLTLRVWDIYDNSTTSTLAFTVSENGTPDFDVTATSSATSTSTRFITSFNNTSETGTTVRTEVYSIIGRRVWHEEKAVEAGYNFAAFDWNLTDYAGNRLPRGVYLYRSVVGSNETDTKKMIIL